MKSTHLAYPLEVAITTEVLSNNDNKDGCIDDSDLGVTTPPIENYDNFHNTSKKNTDMNHNNVATQVPNLGLRHGLGL